MASQFEIIESPIISGTVTTAMDNIISSVGTSGTPIVAAFNQGRSILVGFVEA